MSASGREQMEAHFIDPIDFNLVAYMLDWEYEQSMIKKAKDEADEISAALEPTNNNKKKETRL